MSTSTDPLASVRLKLQRSREHLDGLYFEISSYLWRNPYDAAVSLDQETNELVVRMIVRESPPAGWAPRLGDFIHNLRSALDNLAAALVLSVNPTASLGGTAFPIFKRDPDDPETPPRDKKAWSRMVEGMAIDHIAAIKAVQPFNNPLPVGQIDTLRAINILSNTDKHRGLIPVVGYGGEVAELVVRKLDGWQIGTGVPSPARLIEHETEVARFPLMPLRADPDMDLDIGATVRFTLTVAHSDIPVTTGLDEVLRAGYTRTLDVIKRFEARFFPS